MRREDERLGPGLRRRRQGEALWQWRRQVDFQSPVMIYPEHGLAVAVGAIAGLVTRIFCRVTGGEAPR